MRFEVSQPRQVGESYTHINTRTAFSILVSTWISRKQCLVCVWLVWSFCVWLVCSVLELAGFGIGITCVLGWLQTQYSAEAGLEHLIL